MTEAVHPCCDPSTPIVIWDGTPRGEIISISGIEAYISHPLNGYQPTNVGGQSQSRIIVFLTEAYGIYLPNAQLLADSFASQLHCPVLMPDQFAGQARQPRDITPQIPSNLESTVVPWVEDPSDPNFELRGIRVPVKEKPEISDAFPFLKPPWWGEKEPAEFEKWKRRHEPEVTDPILEKVVVWIRKEYGEQTRIGGVGYCFGGRYVIRLMANGIIDVGVVNHPSFFTMGEVGKLGAGKQLAIYAAETDDILPPEKRREMEDRLTSQKVTWMSTVFSGTKHGFSVRGDLNVKEERLAKERAFRGAVEWFQDWL